ncbi:hypothetical protein GQ44DRAFT_826515 [Phaeosphaeriaceae sp. PMI808]|nr:hypothetical protein GQ44DRAFT_826515 [Phaeosphaeriaceae sp. PMI808]
MASRGGGFSSRMRKPYMIISIDFGTTFSGVCWTWSGDLERVHTIQSWDDVGSAKVPTRMQYKDDNSTAWGFEAENTATTFDWFKLILDYENLPLETQTSQRVQQAYNKLKEWPRYRGNPIKSAMRVSVDYIQRIWRHAVNTILEEEGQTWAHGMPCKVIITRPAIWSQKASLRTRNIAEKAIKQHNSPFESIDISMVSEPEAAAQAVLQAPTIARRPDLTRPNDIYLICDAGGGTVDVISYEVQSLDPLTLVECVEGKGGLCGAIFIDNEFERLLRSSVGTRKWDRLTMDEYSRVMETQWERGIKRQFDSTKRYMNWTVDVPGIGSFPFNCNQIETLFQPVCSKARTLIKQQVDQVQRTHNKKPKAIILVGGLGSSRYLSHLLKIEYQGEIEIRHSPGNQTWSAVCRGAVMAGAKEIVMSRICRSHYGITFDEPYDSKNREHVALIDRIQWCEDDQRYMVPKRMDWIVRRGQKIPHISPSPCYTSMERVRRSDWTPEIALCLWVCDDREPPRWKNNDVKLFCKIILTLGTTFENLTPYVSPTNEEFGEAEVKLFMLPNGNMLDFWVYFQDRRLDMEVEWPDHRTNSDHVFIEADT